MRLGMAGSLRGRMNDAGRAALRDVNRFRRSLTGARAASGAMSAAALHAQWLTYLASEKRATGSPCAPGDDVERYLDFPPAIAADRPMAMMMACWARPIYAPSRVAPGRGSRRPPFARTLARCAPPSLSRTPRRHRQRRRDERRRAEAAAHAAPTARRRRRGARWKRRADARPRRPAWGAGARRGGADAALRRGLRISEALGLYRRGTRRPARLAIRGKGGASVWCRCCRSSARRSPAMWSRALSDRA